MFCIAELKRQKSVIIHYSERFRVFHLQNARYIQNSSKTEIQEINLPNEYPIMLNMAK